MNILFEIGHPAHVHLYRNVISELKIKNHNVYVCVKDIESAKKLLIFYGISYINLGIKHDSLFNKVIDQIKYTLRVLKIIKKKRIEMVIGTMPAVYASKITKMKSIILDDDDDDVQPLFVKYAHPYCDTILSPSALIGNRRCSSTIFYNGYHELAYLHPKHFNPDINVLKELDIQTDEPFFIMRFNVFKAHHDVGINGLTLHHKLRLIEVLEPYGKIFITTERDIEPELKKYQLSTSPEKIHSLLYYATMFLGDSQTMTSEAAVLGTPAIRCNDFVGRIAYLEEEEEKYGLTYGFKPEDFDNLLITIRELLEIPTLKQEWHKRRKKMLSEKIDVTSFLVWFVENYPESVKVMKEDPNYQDRFK